MQNLLTVTTLNNQIKSLLEAHYLSVHVEGEVSRVTYHASGHLYFTLKDNNAAISCVMFKGNNQKLKFRLEEGMHVILFGSISVYTPRGSYQINCISMQPAGSGALALAYEQRKKELKERGYFATEIKKPLPTIPKHIVLITSKTGAAIEDMKRVAQKRWNLLKITLIDTIVQGESAAASIANHIALADRLLADVIVIARGGGSLEDLWAFNEEIVAEAIYQAKTPIVSAVGHEIDTMISDYCADLRAPTPSAAMELILPDQTEYLMRLDNFIERYHDSFRQVMHKKRQGLIHLKEMFRQHSISHQLHLYNEQMTMLKKRFEQQNKLIIEKKEQEINHLHTIMIEKMHHRFQEKKQQISHLLESYHNNNPKIRDKKGFAQVVKDGKPIELSTLREEDIIQLQDSKHLLEAKIISTKTI